MDLMFPVTLGQSLELTLSEVGLSDKFDYLPHELSIGEQQRVAIARTLAKNPDLILADEPTGNLDTETGNKIIELLLRYSSSNGASLILVTHANFPIEMMDSVYELENGILSIIS